MVHKTILILLPGQAPNVTSFVKGVVRNKVLNTTLTKEVPDDMDQLLEKHNLRRALRIGTWIARIVHNFTSHVKLSGPLSTAEIDTVRNSGFSIYRRENV